jgi:hypothetical protein
MSRELPRTPSVYLSMFTGASLSAAWISARPWDYFVAVCVGTAACACLLLFLMARGFDESILEYRRRRAHEAELLAKQPDGDPTKRVA